MRRAAVAVQGVSEPSAPECETVDQPASSAIKPAPATPVAAAPRDASPASLFGGPASVPLHLAVETKPNASAPVPRLSREEAQRRLDALRRRYEQDAPHQHFVTDHHSIVFGEGDAAARLMFIGEAPGAEEDRTGRPFVGRAGQLLEKMLGAMGLKREQVYITNVLKTRPPNNATPTMEEASLCAPYLYEQVAIIRPEVIVTLGLPATRVVLNTADSMTRLRGRWSAFTPPPTALSGQFGDGPRLSVPVMPTYHPAFLLRSYTTENRQKVWSDLCMVLERLGINPPAKRPTAG